MSLVQEAFPWLIILLLLSALLWLQLVVKQASLPKAEKKSKQPWSLRPKTPKDCPGCAAQVQLRQVNPPPAELPPSWETVKGTDGRKKTVDTEGQACDNPACQYINVRDASIHALAGTERAPGRITARSVLPRPATAIRAGERTANEGPALVAPETRRTAWLWAAIDPRTKIIPVLYLGRWATADAMLFIHEPVARLAEGCVPLFISDGLRQYYWAITAHFGSWLMLSGKRVAAWVVTSG